MQNKCCCSPAVRQLLFYSFATFYLYLGALLESANRTQNPTTHISSFKNNSKIGRGFSYVLTLMGLPVPNIIKLNVNLTLKNIQTNKNHFFARLSTFSETTVIFWMPVVLLGIFLVKKLFKYFLISRISFYISLISLFFQTR